MLWCSPLRQWASYWDQCQDAVYEPCDGVPEDEPCVQSRVRRRGVARARSWPPDTGSPSSGILMTAGRESLRQRKLSQATSCDRLTKISFKAWMGLNIWKPQHYEAAHGKAFLTILSPPSSYTGWNEIENTLSAVRDLETWGVSQAQTGRGTSHPFLQSNLASI